MTLDADEIRKWAATQGLDGDLEALSRDERVHGLVQAAVDEVNAARSRFEQLKRFAILPRDFTMEAGEITPTLKLKRRAILEHFADTVDELYSNGSDLPV